MKKSILLALLVIAGCAAMQNQAPAPAPAAAQSQFKNLQVLPKDIPREQLLATMRSFTRALGVRCNHCHVVTATEPKEVLDFPSDAKEEKRVARVMIRMATDINRTWLPRVEEAEGHPPGPPPEQPRVSCWTCHRGKPEPEMPPPPPPQPAAPAPAPSAAS